MYDLTVQGITDFARYTSLLPQRKVARDPLSGIVDGVNSVFYTQFYPILASGSLTVSSASGSTIATTSVDYDTGEIVLPNAPSFQPRATYTFTPFTSGQRLSFLISGFEEMQGRWVRETWRLTSGSSSYIAADETSTHIYIADYDSVSGSVSDPKCYGNEVFSNLPTQVGFYMVCCEYAYIKRQMVEGALNGIEFREGRGVLVNRMDVPKHLALALEETDKQVIRKMKAAFDQYYQAGEQFGGNILPAHTKDYVDNFEWQSDA